MTARLALCLFLVAPSLASESPLPPQGLVEVLPVGDVVADGVSPVTVHVLALRPDGSPMDDLTVKLKSREATEIGGWKHEGGGIYSFSLIPLAVERPGRATVRLRGRTADKAFKVDLRASVPVVAPPPSGLLLSANPAELLSGQRDEATLSFGIAGVGFLDPAHLVVRTSIGEIGELADVGGGRLVGRLSVAKVKDPGLALVTVADVRYPDRLYAAAAVPVTVQREVRVRAGRGASVLLRVDGREFGPAEAKGGWARVPDVVLPPGGSEIVQTTVVDGKPSESTLDLGLPPARRIALVPPPASVAADPASPVPIRVFVVGADGRPDPGATPQITTEAGEIVQTTYEGAGIYVATLRPERRSVGKTVNLKAELPGERGQSDQITFEVTGVRAAGVQVEADPDPLASARTATLTAVVSDADGAPLSGRAVDWNLTGATADGLAVVGPQGRVIQKIKTFGGPVEAHVTALTPPSRNPARSVVMVPVRTWLPPDSISSARILVLALDGSGYPVAGARLGVQVESGDGSVPAEVVTDERGLGEIFYTAGSGLRLVRLRAYMPGVSAVASLIQGPPSLQQIALPVSGTREQQERHERWIGVAVMHRIDVE